MILFGPLLTILVCASAFWKGGPPERCAAAGLVVAQIADVIGQLILGLGSVSSLIAADLILGFGLIACAALHPRRWLYIEVGLAAALLLVHAFMMDGVSDMTPAYRGAVDVFDALLLGILAWATWRSWRRA